MKNIFQQHNFFRILSLEAPVEGYGTPDSCQQDFANPFGITSLFFIYK